MINLDHLDPDQRQAATALRGPVAILAGAGTGKTRTITYRIAHQIDQGIVSPHRVMADYAECRDNCECGFLQSA